MLAQVLDIWIREKAICRFWSRRTRSCWLLIGWLYRRRRRSVFEKNWITHGLERSRRLVYILWLSYRECRSRTPCSVQKLSTLLLPITPQDNSTFSFSHSRIVHIFVGPSSSCACGLQNSRSLDLQIERKWFLH